MGSDQTDPSAEKNQQQANDEGGSSSPEDSPIQICGVALRLADNGQILAELTIDQSQIPIPVTLMSLRSQLAAEELSAFWIDEDALKMVVNKAASGEVGREVVGERRDAKAEVTVVNNKVAALIDLERAYGGEPFSKETLKELLVKNRVSENCIQDELLQAALDAGEGKNLVVAKELEPVAGEDGYLKVLIEESVSTLNEGADGKVDFHKLQEFVVVEEGDELARVTPATAGTPGEDVMGMPIKPTPGKAFNFASKLEGAEKDSADPHLLRATVKGHPVILKDGVKVDPTLVLPNVNLASGNIDFDGSVLVKGSVASGYELKATGDVIVKDTVDKARIIAGGNISVANGIIGEDRTAKPKKRKANMGGDEAEEPEEEDDFETMQMGSYLSAKGDIEARFVNLAEIKSDQTVKVREYLMHSRVTAKEDVLMGQSGGRGAIFGGETVAGRSVIVNNLGNDAYIKTSVEVGEANKDAEKSKELRIQTQKRRADHDKLSVAIEKIRRFEKTRPLTEELQVKSDKIEKTLTALDAQLKKFEAVKEQLNERKKRRMPASVEVKNILYPNVSLMVDGLGHQQDVESKAVCLKNKDEEIVLSAFVPR